MNQLLSVSTFASGVCSHVRPGNQAHHALGGSDSRGQGACAVFQDADGVVLNAGSKFEYELSVEDVALVRELWTAPLPDQAAS